MHRGLDMTKGIKGLNYVATYKDKNPATGKITKKTEMITVTPAGSIVKFGTNKVIHKDQITYVKVLDHFEAKEIPYDIFEKMYLR